MSEYAKNIQTIEDMWKKRIEMREEGGGRMRQPKKDHAAPKQKQPAVEYIWEERGCMQKRREPIVRCGDCKHYDPNDEPSDVYPNSYWCDKLTVYMPPNGFCSFGKRREP